MSLIPGTRLGVYDITAQIGDGGMGQVYRATDTKLKRQVAIKILPPSLAADHDRLARFQREAEVLASLNHPHIAAIYGLEESDGVSALVMELVEGEDLSQRIARGPIPFDEALPIAKQIAEALEAAHEQGIIHRDLKPANIRVRRDGTVKVLDFGLAKAIERLDGSGAGSMSPTLTSPAMTAAGVISVLPPTWRRSRRKARRSTNARTSGHSASCCSEMLSGRALFASDSVAETIGLVCTRDPEWTALPAGTPARVEGLLHRCLTREPRNRLRDIGEARIRLAGGDESRTATSAMGSRWRASTIAAAAAVGAVARGVLGSTLIGRRTPTPAAPHLRRFELPGAVAATTAWPVISPDGSRVAYIAGTHLRVQALDMLESQDLGAVPVAAKNVFWSPDGKTIGFTAEATVRTIPAAGGPEFVVCQIPASGNALDVLWRADNSILIAVWRDSLYRVPAVGGTPEIFLRMNPTTEVDFHSVTELPGNRFLVGTHLREPWPEQPSIDHEQQELYDGSRRTVLISAPNVTHFVYAPPGRLLFLRTDANIGVWSIPFREGPLDLSRAARVEAGAVQFSAAGDGTLLASIRPSSPAKAELVWVDRSGAASAVPGSPIDVVEGANQNVAVSPDGRRVVFVAGTPAGVFVRDLMSGVDTRLTFDRHQYDTPSWFPRGDQVIYLTDVAMTRASAPGNRGTTFLGKITAQRADGTDRPRELGTATAVPRVSPDGQRLIFVVDDTGRGRLRVAPIGADGSIGAAQPLFRGDDEPNVRWFDVSRDGRLLSYTAEDASRRLDVFVTEFPSATGRWQVQAGGNIPQFSPAGAELFFLSGTIVNGQMRGRFDVRPIASAPTVHLGPATHLFDLNGPQAPSLGAVGYAVAPDGRRILTARMLRPEGQPTRRVVLIQHWTAAMPEDSPH